MCGISGKINPNGFEEFDIKLMTDLIQHRGPDDEGYVSFKDSKGLPVCMGGKSTPIEVYSSNYPYSPIDSIEVSKQLRVQIAFGHRRLSILDLSPSGHQPMTYLNNRYWIVFNGEIYNYIEIRTELISFGYEFISQSDTEVLLAAYNKWGSDCQNHFNGMWAFVIFDRERDEIFMSRDRFGIKPLYYWFSPDGSFCFASEIKQFTVLQGWKAKLNPQRVYDYLVYSYTDHTDETMFHGVHQLFGGHYYKAKINEIKPDLHGKINTVKWYEVPSNTFNGTFKQASKRFEKLFKSAIDLHLRADVPQGSALSGGLDSSSIVCEVNNILKKQGITNLQKTFSSCSHDKRFDEKKWIDIVVEQTSVDAHYIYPKMEDIFIKSSDLIWHHDEPYQSQSAFLAYNVFEYAKSKEMKVLLNGQGADEYLGGYGQFTSVRIRSMFKNFEWLKLKKEIQNSSNYKKHSYSYIFQSILPYSIRLFLIKNLKDKRIRNLVDNNYLGALNRHPDESIDVSKKTVPNISKHLTFHSTLPKYLKWEDRNSMAHSIESRVPFLDYRLFEFAYSLPDSYLDFHGETKRILRQGLKEILPEKIKNRKDKMGYISPEEMWVKEKNPALFRKKLEEAIIISKGILKPESLEYFDKIVAGKIPFDYTYWRHILFAEWIKRFEINLNESCKRIP